MLLSKLCSLRTTLHSVGELARSHHGFLHMQTPSNDCLSLNGAPTCVQVPVVDGAHQVFKCDHCSGCMTDFATIGHSYVWGVSPEGPYHYGKTGGWMERIPDVRTSSHADIFNST